MEINIETEGLDEILKKLGYLTMKKALNQAIKKSILITEREAKLRTPVITGLLRNSYETSFKDLEGEIRNYREYAPYVEAKRHFMEETRDYMDTRVQGIFEGEIENMLKNLE